MQDVDVVTLLMRWLHVLAAMATLGGATFMRFGLLPAAAESLDEPAQQKLREAVRARWARFVHGTIAVLLVTGLVNLLRFSMSPGAPAMPYQAIFGIKFLLALVVFFVATVIVGKSPAFRRARENMHGWLSGLIVLTVLIVLLSGILNQLRNTGRTPAAPATATQVTND